MLFAFKSLLCCDRRLQPKGTSMGMWRTAWILLWLVSGAAWSQDVVREYHTTVELDVDRSGQVATATADPSLPAALASPLEKAVQVWRFKPVQREGQPVTARTYAYVTAKIINEPSGTYGLKVVYNSNGPKVDQAFQPRYPAQMIRLRQTGSVDMQAVVRPDGSLTDIALVTGTGHHHHIQGFVRAAREAMQHWHALPEWVDGKPVATRFRTRMNFNLEPVRSDGTPIRSRAPVHNSKSAAQGPAVEAPVAMDSPLVPLHVGSS